MGECVSLQGHAQSLTQHDKTNTSINRQALAPLHVLAPLTFLDQSITPTEELGSRTQPRWSVYQSPSGEMKKSQVRSSSLQCNSNGEFNLSSLDLVRERRPDQEEQNLTNLQANILHRPDQFSTRSQTSLRDEPESGSMQCNSHTELHSHPVRDVNPDQFDSNEQFNLSKLHPFGELKPEKLNSSSLNIFQEMKSDPVISNHTELSDVEEADVLLPERSFNMHRSVSLLLEDPQIHQQKSFMVPQSPDPVSQDVPMSPEPAPRFGWFQVESPVQPTEPDLDVMVESLPQTSRPGLNVHVDQHSSSLLNQSGFLLSKRSFDRRKSEKSLFPSLNTAEKSVCASPCRGSDPVCDVPMSPAAEPGLNWICSGSPVWKAEADLDVMITPQQNNKTCIMMDVLEISQKLNCDVPMSPTQPYAPPTSSGTCLMF